MTIPMQTYRIVNTRSGRRNRKLQCVGTFRVGTESGYTVFKLIINRGKQQRQVEEMSELIQDTIVMLNNNGLKVERIGKLRRISDLEKMSK